MKVKEASLVFASTVLSLMFPLMLAAAPRDEGRMDQALRELNGNQLQNAYQTLDSVEMSSLSYRMAYLEMQKIHYRNQNWDKFFGYASFYRKHLLSEFLQPELLSLEVLALAKHCQLDAAQNVLAMAQQLVNFLKSQATKPVPALAGLYARELKRHGGAVSALHTTLERFEGDLRAVENILILQAELPGVVNSNPVSTSFAAFSKTLFWNVSADARAKILERAVKTPKSLRVYVRNRCEKGSL